MLTKQNHTSVIAAGLALFSMFFGVGDLIWPLVLGGESGSMSFWTLCGFLMTAVALPFLGLLALILFMGDYVAFFGRVGKIPAFLLIAFLQIVVGPVGSIPHLLTISYAALKPYMFSSFGFLGFCVVAGLITLSFSINRARVVDLLGIVLTPILLLSVLPFIVKGLISAPAAPVLGNGIVDSFWVGLKSGYQSLNLLSSFIFLPLILTYFLADEDYLETPEGKAQVAKKMVHASMIAMGLLSFMYISLIYVGSFYVPLLPFNTANDASLTALALYQFGWIGVFIATIAMILTSLTAIIPLTSIGADYIRNEIFKDKIGDTIPQIIVLGLSIAVAHVGFEGPLTLLEPAVMVLYPALIVLCLLNVRERLYQIPAQKAPVIATFGITSFFYFA